MHSIAGACQPARLEMLQCTYSCVEVKCEIILHCERCVMQEMTIYT